MTKTEGKRGYARSQPAPTVDAAKAAAFEQAWATFDTEYRAFEARPYDSTGNMPADATDAMDDAADAVFSAPAPHGEALARKIALYAYPNHIDGWLTDPALRAKVAAEDDEDAKRLLVMFLDALALSGVPASIDVPQVVKTSARVTAEYDRALALMQPYLDAQDNDDNDAPDPPRALRDRLHAAYNAFVSTRADDLGHVARKISMFAMELLGLDVDVSEELTRALAGDGLERHVAEFFQQATALSASPIGSVSAGDWHMLALRSELIAKRCADTQWSRYAVNPLGLAELVTLQTSIQEDIRLLAADLWPGAVSDAMNTIYGSGSPDDDPGDGPKGGLPRLPETSPHDADTLRVVALDAERKRLAAEYEASDEDESLWEASLAAEAELRTTPCTSVVAAAIKLAAFAEGFDDGSRGDDEAMFKQVLGYLLSAVKGSDGPKGGLPPPTPAANTDAGPASLLDFEPWSEEAAHVPSEEAWARMQGLHLFTLRVASKILQQTPAEVIADLERWEAEHVVGGQGEPMVEAVGTRLQDTQALFEACANMTGTAFARLLATGLHVYGDELQLPARDGQGEA